MTSPAGTAEDAAPSHVPDAARAAPLLSVRDLQMYFPVTRGIILQRQIGAVQAVETSKETPSTACTAPI